MSPSSLKSHARMICDTCFPQSKNIEKLRQSRKRLSLIIHRTKKHNLKFPATPNFHLRFFSQWFAAATCPLRPPQGCRGPRGRSCAPWASPRVPILLSVTPSGGSIPPLPSVSIASKIHTRPPEVPPPPLYDTPPQPFPPSSAWLALEGVRGGGARPPFFQHKPLFLD